MNVGFIGFGPKGSSIAHAISDAGHSLHIWTDDPGAAIGIEDHAHVEIGTLEELARRCEVIALCVDRTTLESIVYDGGLLAAMGAGSVLITHGVESPEACVRLAAEGASQEVGVLDAPVSVPMVGRAPGEPPWGVVMVGGDAAVVERCRELLSVVARRLFHVGQAGLGDIAKLMNNTLHAANLANAAEALQVAEKLGYDLEVFMDLIQASSGASFSFGSIPTTPLSRAEPLREILGREVSELAAVLDTRAIDAPPLLDVAQRGAIEVGDALRQFNRSAAQPA